MKNEETTDFLTVQRRQYLGLIGGGLVMAASGLAAAQTSSAPRETGYVPSTKKKMLLMSSSRAGSSGFLEHADDQFAALYGDTKGLNVIFIPYAAVTYGFDEFENRVKPVFARLGHNITSIHHASDARAAVESADAIAIGGGNSFALLKRMYDSNIVDIITARVNDGIPYVGWSAGGNVAGPSIRTTNDMPIVEPPSLNSLNLIPFQTNPHFISGKPAGHNGESREDRLNEFLAINPTEELVAMPEGTALLCEGEEATVLGGAPMLWFRQGGTIEQIAPGAKFALNSIHP